MHKMKKIGSPECACGMEKSETLSHFLLNCPLYEQIRQQYIPQLINLNTNISEICDSEYLLMLSILDPVSSKLPEKLINNWSSIGKAILLQDVHEERKNLR